VNRVHFRWERRPSQPAAEALRRVVSETLRRLDVSESDVHVLVTGDVQMRRLNRGWRDQDLSTDVLSFPDGDLLPSRRVLLGQIVVSLDAARRQAGELGHTELRELEELVLHGTIHLLGYDHERDQGEMDELELKLLEELLP
jgi:probable rRNA maturation factor